MFLTQLQLRNWRSYRQVTFKMPPPDGSGRKNVILIGAQNGVGKTSFLMALYLGMFGREAMPLIEGFRSKIESDDKLLSYQKLMESILHRPSKNVEEPHCSVSLTFELDGAPVLIQRRWKFRKGGKPRDLDSPDGEEVLIETDGRPKLFTSWQDANKRIEELLFPSNVMPCLFFDGEQAQARVEAAGGRALFDAVKALYGTGLLDQLSESLKHYVNNERVRLQRDVGSVRVDELDDKRQQLDSYREQLKSIQEQLIGARQHRAATEDKRLQLESNLYSMVGDSAADVEEYSASMAALTAEEEKLKQQLVSGISQLALPLALSKKLLPLLTMLEQEQVRGRWLLLKDEAAEKANNIVESVLPSDGQAKVSPPLLATQAEQLRESLEKALEALWSPPPSDCAEEFRFPFLNDSDRTAAITAIKRASQDSPDSLTEVAVEFHRVTSRLAETKQRFERTKDIQPQLQKLRSELQALHDEQREQNSIVNGLETQERGLQQTISDLRGAIGQMEAKREAGSPIKEKLEVAQRIRTLVDDAKDRLIPLVLETLESRCSEHFAGMISDEYSRFKTRFQPDSEPWLEGPTGQQVWVSSLSGAQKRAFGLAFTLAVAEVAQNEAPIVIDTPVGNMDSVYRARVLQYVSEVAPGQVILLSHDKEIDSDFAKVIEKRVRKKFLVEFAPVEDGAGVSTVHEDQYF